MGWSSVPWTGTRFSASPGEPPMRTAACNSDYAGLNPRQESDDPPRSRKLSDKGVCGQEAVGFVYLIKSGRFYKIGKSNAPGRREYELAIQLPETTRTIHTIRTDDPSGIDAYGHKRFEAKRKKGEWFDLDATDVATFKRRKFM